MLLSNGLHHSENLPVKFGFSPQIVPANIVKKLPSQRCFKPLLIPIFNFPRKRPTLAFTGKVVHTRLSEKDRTQGTHGETGAVSDGGVASLPSERSARFGNLRGQGVERQTLPLLGLGWGTLEERRGPAGQRCAYARRCSKRRGPAGLRDPVSALLIMW